MTYEPKIGTRMSAPFEDTEICIHKGALSTDGSMEETAAHMAKVLAMVVEGGIEPHDSPSRDMLCMLAKVIREKYPHELS